MRQTRPHFLTFLFLGASASGFIASVAVYISYRADRTILRDVAMSVTEGIDDPSEQVLALLGWVHDLEGSASNPAYYFMQRLRATPVQVLELGGDCADKSRLLYTLLSEIEISSSMAMCFDEVTNEPTHTVVEARIGKNEYMLVDPAFNLFFPEGADGYYDLMDLRRDAEILPERIRVLLAQNPVSTARDRYYLSASTTYHTTSTFNWTKNSLTKFAYAMAHALFGEDVYRLRRPCFLECPKITLLMLLLAISGAACVAGLVVRRWCSAVKPVEHAHPEAMISHETSAQPVTA